MADIGRFLILAGLTIAVIGVLLLVVGRFGGGRLPGDLTWSRGNVRVFAPFGTMLLLSIILTVILNVISRWRR